MKIESSKKEVITSQDIQNRYIDLYLFMMDYLWDLKVVKELANLEIAIYKRFPDKDEMSNCLHKLRYDIQATYNELAEDGEEDFKKYYEALDEAIEDFDANTGYEIYMVASVLDPEEILDEAESEKEDIEPEKKKIDIKDIDIKRGET